MKKLRRFVDSPIKLWLLLTCALLLGLILHESLIGRWGAIADASREGALTRQPSGVLRDFRIAIVHCLLVGYLCAALFAVVRGGRRTVLQLQSVLDCTVEECAALAASIRFTRGGLGAAALLGLAFGFLTPYLVPPVPESLWNPASWSPEVAWHRVLGPITSVLAFVLVYAILSVSGRMSRLASRLGSIDLFDHRPLTPFTQQGLKNALLLIGLPSIYGLMLLTETGVGVVALIIALATLTGAALALVLPLRGVHQRIAQAKKAELEWVEVKLRQQRTVLKTGADRTSGDLADLAAYRELVRSVRDWPISTSSYVRFALYLLIPVVSWAAAALVERLVDALL